MPEPVEAVREGSRWLHAKPSRDSFAEWFNAIPLHAGMEHARFIEGITLIEQTAKQKFTKVVNDEYVIAERDVLQFVPYAKVETRVSYFWDLMDKHKDEWIGVIEPVEQRHAPAHLPPGFFELPVKTGPETGTRFLGCNIRVVVFERESYARSLLKDSPVNPVISGVGTKIVPYVRSGRNDRVWADENCVMKAETGAIGRALGMAGMLVIPGSGIASAEDMMEALGAPPTEGVPGGAEAARLPDDGSQGAGAAESAPGTPEEATDDQLRAKAKTLADTLKEDHPEAFTAYRAWHSDRKLGPLSGVNGPALKGLVRKLEKTLDEARQGQPASVAETPAEEPQEPTPKET